MLQSNLGKQQYCFSFLFARWQQQFTTACFN